MDKTLSCRNLYKNKKPIECNLFVDYSARFKIQLQFRLWQRDREDFWQIEWFRCHRVWIGHKAGRQMWLAPRRWYSPSHVHAPASPFGTHSLWIRSAIWVLPACLFCIAGTIRSNRSSSAVAKPETSSWHHATSASAWNPIRIHRRYQHTESRRRRRNHASAGAQ